MIRNKYDVLFLLFWAGVCFGAPLLEKLIF